MAIRFDRFAGRFAIDKACVGIVQLHSYFGYWFSIPFVPNHLTENSGGCTGFAPARAAELSDTGRICGKPRPDTNRGDDGKYPGPDPETPATGMRGRYRSFGVTA